MIRGIEKSYAPVLQKYRDLLKGGKAPAEPFKFPTYEEMVKKIPGLTKERWEAFLASPEGKKMYGGK